MTVPDILLNNGVIIPQLGFGVFLIKPEDTKDAVLTALETGYRHIDTAQMYGNERQVGEAIRESGIPRDEIFVTSKLNNNAHDPAVALEAGKRSVETLGIGPMDLFLIHWPMPAVGDYVATWRSMEKLYRDGSARAIGVSNFQIPHLERLIDEAQVVPAINQIEVHPYLTQVPLRAYDGTHGIVTEAWSPIGRGAVLDDPVLVQIAAEVGRTVAQVTLRWHIQHGNVIFPKSTHPERIAENFQLFDFALNHDQMHRIDELNRDERVGPDPDEFNWIPE